MTYCVRKYLFSSFGWIDKFVSCLSHIFQIYDQFNCTYTIKTTDSLWGYDEYLKKANRTIVFTENREVQNCECECVKSEAFFNSKLRTTHICTGEFLLKQEWWRGRERATKEFLICAISKKNGSKINETVTAAEGSPLDLSHCGSMPCFDACRCLCIYLPHRAIHILLLPSHSHHLSFSCVPPSYSHHTAPCDPLHKY